MDPAGSNHLAGRTVAVSVVRSTFDSVRRSNNPLQVRHILQVQVKHILQVQVKRIHQEHVSRNTLRLRADLNVLDLACATGC